MADFNLRYDELKRECPPESDKEGFRRGLAALCEEAKAAGREAWRLFFEARLLYHDGADREEILAAWDVAIQAAQASSNPDDRVPWSWALFSKGATLGEQNRPEEAIALYDEVASRFGDSPELVLRAQVASALVNKGVALGKKNRPEKAIAVYDEVVSRFGGSPEVALREQVAGALVNKGATLEEQNHPEEAIVVYDEVVFDVGDSQEIPLREQVARALVNKAVALGELSRLEEGIAVCDEAVSRFGNSQEAVLREGVARALLNKGAMIGQQNRPEEAIAVFDEVVSRFGDSPELPLREMVARAFVGKGMTLGNQKRREEAIAACDEVVSRFGNFPELALREMVARALVNKGVELGQQNRPEKAIAVYDEVASHFGDSTEPALRAQVAKALFNKGVALGSLNRPEDALQSQQKALEYASEGSVVRQLIAASQSLDVKREGKPPESAGKNSEIVELIHRLIEKFPKETSAAFLNSMDERMQRAKGFLSAQSAFRGGDGSRALFLDLRAWNSWTPAVPDQHEANRGGGYYIRYKGQGIVIDPGYDFIRNFDAVLGRIHDIHHVVLTHAHNDHTEDFESLLSLVHQYNRERKGEGAKERKQVHLYVNHTAYRKISGFVPLDGNPSIGKPIEVLAPGTPDAPRRIPLHGLPGATLIPVPAYHEDTVAADSAIGVGFLFEFPDGERKVLFTGDTSYFPSKMDDNGRPIRDEKGDLQPDTDAPDRTLNNVYPRELLPPDLMVPHIGSIKKEEFETRGLGLDAAESKGAAGSKEPPYFYSNHLGLRGTALLLAGIRPKAALLSELGEELMDIRFKLAHLIEEFLEAVKMKDEHSVHLIPGDLTVAYDIGEGKFFCHETQKYLSPEKIRYVAFREFRESPFYAETMREMVEKSELDQSEPSIEPRPVLRAYAVLAETLEKKSDGHIVPSKTAEEKIKRGFLEALRERKICPYDPSA